MRPQERVIALAEEQVGYLGKKTNAQLDNPKANAGGKWNKFARDLDDLGDFYNGRKNGYDWCDVFVDWLFVTAFGRETGQRMLYQPDRSLGAGTAYSLNYYRQKGRLFTTPEPGDQIFFGDIKSTWHTGLVVKAAGGYVHTIEGNAGNPAAVRACKYLLGNRTIKGYGRPDWPLAAKEIEEDDMKYYEKLKDVPAHYQPTIRKLMERGVLKGRSDPDPNRLDDNVLDVSEEYCRVMTTFDLMGKLD